MDKFTTLWMPLSRRFYRLAYYILEDRDNAMDAVQDLYLKLWTMRGRLDGVANPFGFGAMMLKNLCIDRLRSSSNPTVSLDKAGDAAGIEYGPDSRLDDRQQADRFLREVENLPEKQRTVLKMRVLQEMDYEEIVKATGLSNNDLRALLSIARKTLKSKLR